MRWKTNQAYASLAPPTFYLSLLGRWGDGKSMGALDQRVEL